MARIESKLAALGLVLPAPMQVPSGVVLPFAMVRIVGKRALVSGHGPLAADGSLAQPLGKVGSDLTVEQGHAAAKLTGLAILASLKRALGVLDRITAWTRVFGMGYPSKRRMFASRRFLSGSARLIRSRRM